MSKTSNANKTNKTVDINSLFNELMIAQSKSDMVSAYEKVGINCVTAPTTKPTPNDLYAQFNKVNCGDLSRIQTTSKLIKLFVTETLASTFSDDIIFVDHIDGGNRTKTATLPKTLENFTMVLNTFIKNGVITIK